MTSKYLNVLNKNKGFYELDFSDFEEFIEFIRPDKSNARELMSELKLRENPIYVESQLLGRIEITQTHILEKSIVYRGHGDSEWDLVPTFYRQPVNNGFIFTDKYIEHNKEKELLLKFQESCDLAGVQLPSDDDQLRRAQKTQLHSYFSKFGHGGWDWFTKEFFELAVFAQHYTVPTRLLDWTKNPLVACYFASSYALSLNYQKEKKISIWVLNSSELTEELEEILEVLDPPKGINQHISHQQGVLTYTRTHRNIFHKFGLRPKLQDLMEHYNCSYRLLKINLSYDHVENLFNFCNFHNFNACHLFRGAHGAATHTKDLVNYENFNYLE
ncbi:FRG domain-containing protein [Acinetobacter nosocomialis]|uniref:FRG domain-containing protein n=1 Tax=Acinetobacter nosocomialis TaxID=106654 RepID=UPI00237D757B|nr:FRG domain-containing protein [Acinetobacter nosocomialis]MDE1703192.1 FRG domain-containing protein [Acinetobacter nosocomialis]HDG7211701.1 FRG domain-containing protein [Acinetobacter nosocomialis]